MKLKVEYKQTREIEIEFPVFMKTACNYYKVISEHKCIQVTDLEGYFEISQGCVDFAFSPDNIKSTEIEFNKAFDRVYKNILKLDN